MKLKNLKELFLLFFDYIEGIVERGNLLTMEKFAESVNKFLEFNEYRILEDKGSISMKQAQEKAEEEYLKFNPRQKIENDFEKTLVSKILKAKLDNKLD